MSIAENLIKIQESLPEKVCLVAVSKTKPNSAIQEAYDAGQRVFGENKALELAQKFEDLPKDIEWHMIGHLQRNKVKYIAPFVTLIHGVESLRLLKEINKQGKKNDRVISCLLQFHIASESSKFGFESEEIEELLNSSEFLEMEHVRIDGVMGMATFTSDETVVRAEFARLKHFFDELKSNHFANNSEFSTISMGMSGDYLLALEEGSTMVRVGSSIFGSR